MPPLKMKPSTVKMPTGKKCDKDIKNIGGAISCSSVKSVFLSLFTMIAGPASLLYINVRCEKNQCVLFHLPLVVPTHLSAYFSVLSYVIVISFLFIMLLACSFYDLEGKKGKLKDVSAGWSMNLGCLLAFSVLVVCVAYLKPEFIRLARAEHLRLLCTITVFCFTCAMMLAFATRAKFMKKDRDLCFLLGFYHGFSMKPKLGRLNLKYYCYASAGLVAWALIDLLIFTSFVLERPLTAPLCFIFVTQYIFILHTLVYEKYLFDRPFMYTEGLGFFWMMRVMMFMPFMFSLPVVFAAVTEVSIPKLVMVGDCVLFMLGFLIYTGSLHEKESYAAGGNYKNVKTIPTSEGKRLLVGGYWSYVQKPDYLGYLLMWLSWTIACGFSPLSIAVLAVVIGTVLFWYHQSSMFLRESYKDAAWTRYTTAVPYKIIPMVY